MTLEVTKGRFKLHGLVTNLTPDSLRGGTSQTTHNAWQAIRFGVKTSPNNTVWVELMGSESEFAYLSTRDKDAKEKTKKIAYEDRYDTDSYPEGYSLIGVGVAIDADEKGKTNREVMSAYDAVDALFNGLQNGDSVYINGKIDWQRYENREGKEVTLHKFSIQNIGLTKEPVNFEAEDFKEVSEFQQEIVYLSSDEVKKDQKVYVSTNVITDKNGTFMPAQFVIESERNPKFAKQFPKLLKYGDMISVQGHILNISEKVEQVEDDDFGSESTTFNVVTHTESYLRVVGVDSTKWEKQKYKMEDFENSASANFGSEGTPWEDDEDEDLPFKR